MTNDMPNDLSRDGMPAEAGLPPVDEVVDRARVLAGISTLADDNNPGDPRACLDGIRQLLVRYDAAAADGRSGEASSAERTEYGLCPPWCVEHYRSTVGGVSYNHSGYPRSVTAESAVREDRLLLVSTWTELREDSDGRRAVGVIEKVPEDAELSHCQLREFARYLLVVAEQVEQINAAVTS